MRQVQNLYRWICVMEQRWSAEVHGYDHETAAEMAGLRDKMAELWPELKVFDEGLDWSEITADARKITAPSPSEVKVATKIERSD